MAQPKPFPGLVWMKNPPRWRGQHKKKFYYFPVKAEEISSNVERMKAVSYARAIKLWEAKKAGLSAKPEDSDGRLWKSLAIKLMEAMNISKDYPAEGMEPYFSSLLADAQKNQAEKKPFPGRDVSGAKLPGDIGTCIERFLDAKKSLVQRDKKSIGTITNLSGSLNHFKAFVGADFNTADIDSNTISTFYSFLDEKIRAKKFKESTCGQIWKNTRQFIKWAVEEEIVEKLPKNFTATDKSFSAPAQKIETYDLPEIKLILDNAIPRMKLWVLLMLNTGGYSSDLSELRHEEVDWKLGIIRRKRTKTRKKENAPEVSYPLWPETFSLLKQFRSNDPIYVLLTEKGARLQSPKLGSKTDRVAGPYNNYMKKLKITKSAKCLRKTSSSLIANNREFGPALATLFLAQAPQGIALKHYLAPNQVDLDRAVAWLGKELGITATACTELQVGSTIHSGSSL